MSPKQLRRLIGFCYATMGVTAALVTWLVWKLDNSANRFLFVGLFWVGALILVGIFHAILGMEARKGPWLVMNRASMSLSLPRRKYVWPITKQLRFEVVTGFNPQPNAEKTRVAELHIRSLAEDQAPAIPIAIVGAVDRRTLQPVADSLNQKISNWTGADDPAKSPVNAVDRTGG